MLWMIGLIQNNSLSFVRLSIQILQFNILQHKKSHKTRVTAEYIKIKYMIYKQNRLLRNHPGEVFG